MAKAATKQDQNIEPTVRVSDFHALTGGLFNAMGYPTFRGRCIMQVVQNAAFSAYAYKDENEEAPALSSAAQMEREIGCGPYKEGIDASLVTIEKPELAGKKPRVDLIRDLLCVDKSIDPAEMEDLAKAIKREAIDAQIKSLVKKNMGGGIGGSKGVARKIAAGLQRLDTMDESWDEAFLTKAVEFLVEYQREDYLRTDDDKANYAYMKAVVNGVQVSADESAEIAFDI
jgi:hypothetical protein